MSGRLLLLAVIIGSLAGCADQSESASERDAREINQRIRDAGGEVPEGGLPRD